VIVRAPAPKRVHQLVEQFGVAFSDDRLSRWSRPVCPLVLGLERDHAFYIEQRIDTIAKAAGVPVEPGKCEPNLVVVVSEHATALRQSIARRGRGLLNSGSRWPIDKVQLRAFAKDDDAPAHVFYLTGESATFGGNALELGGSSTLADVNGAFSNFLFGPPVVSGFGPSRLIPKVDDALQRVFVILDGERVVGLTLQQIAAYVSMVTLAEIKVDRRTWTPSPPCSPTRRRARRRRTIFPSGTGPISARSTTPRPRQASPPSAALCRSGSHTRSRS
jgi:hypothetical protein